MSRKNRCFNFMLSSTPSLASADGHRVSSPTRVVCWVLGTLWGLSVVTGCASARVTQRSAPAERPVPVPRSVAEVPTPELRFSETGFAYVDGKTGQPVTFEELVQRAMQNDIVLVGERHDAETDHQLQAELIRAVGQQTPGLRVGFEMVETSNQRALDRFAQGEIDVDGLYAALEWEKTWGFDPELYRPLWEAVREVNAYPVALNAPRTLVRAVARHGVDALDDQQKQQLPTLDLDDEVHRQAMKEAFQMHHHAGATGDGFERFYTAQVLWDETMAEQLVAARQAGATKVIGVAGNGHVEGYRGIPQRVLRRSASARVLTIVPIHEEDGASLGERVREAVAMRAGDILVVTRPREVLSL